MCGIAGIMNLGRPQPIPRESLARMAAALRHRGPDATGLFRDADVGLSHARLSIIDLRGGDQPISNEDGSVHMVANGEIFNFVELRQRLASRGHIFRTMTDVEAILHLWEEEGEECLNRLNGQFALAIWDARRKTLFLARDRVGICPLFFAKEGSRLLFASEIKALFAEGSLSRALDPRGLDQVFTYWMTLAPRTAFAGVSELPAGHYMTVREGRLRLRRYWDPDFTTLAPASEEVLAEELRSLLEDAVSIRLRADVPVGAYLSGGIDSSVVAALAVQEHDGPLRTFSVAFEDRDYDESLYQMRVARALGTSHESITCGRPDISQAFPAVVWHAEKPILRTAPAPLYLLSRLVRESGYKVVLTGEGSDEILAGYDIFKETKVRRFMERFPESTFRPHILRRLYPYLKTSPIRSVSYARSFFAADTTGYPDICYSHVPRWLTTSRTKFFFSRNLRDLLSGYDATPELMSLLDGATDGYDDLSRAQYLEMKTLLPGYLLSSQGDRMSMANSVEGRFPFLDHRVVEFSCRLPHTLRMKTLTEKYLLRKSVRGLLPSSIVNRTKQPYLAPDAGSFLGPGAPEWVGELLSEENLKRTGHFDARRVAMLIRKCRQVPVLGFKDNMALVGIVSTLLIHHLFVESFEPARSLGATPDQGRQHHAVAV